MADEVLRYLLFGGDFYYPQAGVQDYLGSWNTVNGAKLAGMKTDWAQIVDHETMETVDERWSKNWNQPADD